MSHFYTEFLNGLLFAGGIETIQGPVLAELVRTRGVRRVVSVLQNPPHLTWPHGYFGALTHTVLQAGDDDRLEPAHIHQAIGAVDQLPNSVAPTLVHCQLGQNRSSAIAACFLLAHSPIIFWEEAIAVVEAARTPDLAVIGRSRAEVSPQMRENVRAYCAW